MYTDPRETNDGHVHTLPDGHAHTLPGIDPASSSINAEIRGYISSILAWLIGMQAFVFVFDLARQSNLQIAFEFPFFRMVGS